MDVLEIALIGVPERASGCCAALIDAGFQATIAPDGPGPSGINTFNPRLLEELGVAAIKVIDVEASSDGQIGAVQAVAAPHGFTLRLHGWVHRESIIVASSADEVTR